MGGCFKGLEGSTRKGIERIERKQEEREKEEEERRGNEAEMLTNRDRDQSLRHFLFCVLCSVVG